MAGETLPPVVAVLQGDISDLVAKIAEAKAEVESLDDVKGTPTVDLDVAPFETALAEVEAQLRAFSGMAGDVTLGIQFSDPEALVELQSIDRTLNDIANAMPIDIPVQLEGIQTALAEFIATATAMRVAADAAGGGAGNGGLLALLGWGGGTFGFAAFGSVLSLAGFGFEHLVTTVLGLAGSLSGALVGALTLASGAFAVMGVGMLTDLAGIGQAVGDIKNVVQAQNALTQAIAVYGPQSTEAATAQAQLNYQLSSFSPIARAAVLQAANTAQGFHQMFNQVTGQAEATGAQILNTLMLLGEKFLPIIGRFAAENMAIIQKALVPLETWLAGPGLAIFTQLEVLFQKNLPFAMQAFTNGVELVIKILGYAAQQTGGFTQWLAAFFTKWNSPAAWPTVEKGINTVIALFHTWWDLLKQVALTIYDIFSKTVGLGTTIVQTITKMLAALDKWIQSTSGSASLHNLFEAHLAEIKEILAVLPTLLSDFGQLYLMIAPDLTKIVTGLVTVVGWMLKIPGVGPVLGWAAAIALLVTKMNLLGISMAAIAGIKNIMTLFQALGAGGSWKQAISIAFGSQTVAAQMQAAADTFSAAVTRFAGEEAAGGGGGGLGGLGGAAGGLGGLLTYLAPLGMLASNIVNVWGGVLNLSKQNEASLNSITAVVTGDFKAYGLNATEISQGTALISKAIQSGAIQTPAQLNAVIAYWEQTHAATAAIAQTSSLASKIIGQGFNAVGVNLILWQHALQAAGISGGVAATAQSALSNFIKVHGPVTANEMAAFQFAATNSHMSAASMALAAAALSKFVSAHGPPTAQELLLFEDAITASKGNGLIVQQDMAILSKFVSLHGPLTATEFGVFQTLITTSGISAGTINSVMATVAAFVKTHGPLTTAEMYAIQIQLNHGQTSAFDIALSLQTMLSNMQQAVQSSASIAAGLAALHKAIPNTINMTGGGKGVLGFATGGLAEFPTQGALAMLHGTEMVVPMEKAGWLWPLMSTAVATGKPPVPIPGPMPGASVGPVSRGSGGGGMSSQYNVQITMPGGVNLTPQVIATAVAQGLERHDNDLMIKMGMSPRVGAM